MQAIRTHGAPVAPLATPLGALLATPVARLSALMLGLALSAAASGGPDPQVPHAFAAGWQGEIVCEVLQETDELRMARCSFPPGVGHEFHYHDPHFGYALSAGRMRITDPEGVREVDIPAGTTWSSDTETLHEVINIGDTTATYLIIEPRLANPSGAPREDAP